MKQQPLPHLAWRGLDLALSRVSTETVKSIAGQGYGLVLVLCSVDGREEKI